MMTYDEERKLAYEIYSDYQGEDYASLEDFEEAYVCVWDSEEAFAEALASDNEMIPDYLSWPINCIDWERAAHDLFIDDYWSAPAPNHSVYVFRRI